MLELAATPFRYHEFLFEHWNKLRGTRAYPMMNELDPAYLGQVWRSCFIVGCSNDEKVSWYYLHKGEELATAEKNEPEIYNYFFNNTKKPIERLYREVVESGRPLIDKSELVDSKNHVVRFRRCLLPLDGGNGKATYIVGCLRWKKFDGKKKNDSSDQSVWQDSRLR